MMDILKRNLRCLLDLSLKTLRRYRSLFNFIFLLGPFLICFTYVISFKKTRSTKITILTKKKTHTKND